MRNCSDVLMRSDHGWRIWTDHQQELKISYLLISHDLALVSSVCDRIIVLYQGQIVETGTAEEIIRQAVHPYTKMLLESIFL